MLKCGIIWARKGYFMYTLFIDTHNQEVVVILYKNKKIVKHVNKLTGYQHSQVTLPTIKSVLEEEKIKPQDLNEIIVVVGPGSFTGVRIAVTIAKTMAYTLNIPIKTIDSLSLKAISCDMKEDFFVSVLEKNGAYLGKFSKDYKALGEFSYYSKSEYEKFLQENNVIDVDKIDYDKLINFMDKCDVTNPHAIKPLYIKRIEVLK